MDYSKKPGQSAAYPAQQPPPYPGGPQAPYQGQQQAPYPGQQAAYPGQQAPYPGQQVPYPGQQAPYPGQPAPYPPAAQPYNAPGQNYGQGGVGQPPIVQGGFVPDPEQGFPGNIGTSFSDKAIRRGFIRKVYGVLMCQLLATAAIISVFMFYEPLKLYTARSSTLYWVALIVALVCIVAMACVTDIRRKFPINVIFLSIFTAAEGFMLGTLTARFNTEAVLIAVGITVGVTLALTLFAFQTKYDFTTCGGMLCAMVIILIISGIILAIMGPSKITIILYGSAGALIFSLYIVYDTQLMMGGKHKYALDPEEFVFASLNLYLDIINLFLYILMIVGASSSD